MGSCRQRRRNHMSNFEGLLASSAAVEEAVDKNMEKNRVLISFVPFSLGTFSIPYGNMEPGELTPIVRTPWWKEFNGVRRLTPEQAANKEPKNATKEYTFPGNVVYSILTQARNTRFGDSGVRSIECLVGLDSEARRKELQQVLLPRHLFYDERGLWKAADLHKRVDEHLYNIIDNYDASSIEAMAAKTCLESSKVGAQWKENVLREAQDEILAGKEKTLKQIQNKWRMEIGAVLDERVRLANSLPTDSKPNQYSQPQQPVQVQLPAELIAAAVAAELAKLGINRPAPVEEAVPAKAKGK